MDTVVRYGKLDNGLTYYIRSNKQPKERADFYIVHNVGSILEEDNQRGLAHFLEHMAFNGTKNFPGKTIINYMESIGAKFGSNVNASTSLDKTVYKLTNIPVTRTSVVDSSILILRDWSANISLTDEEINKERAVVIEEWRTRSNAQRRMSIESKQLKYPGSKYATHDVIGDTAVISQFNPAVLRDFYKKWYRPDLQAVIIVGDVDVDQVEQRIKQVFGDIPTPENPAERIVYTIPDNKEPIVSIVSDPEAKVSSFSILFKHKPMADSLRTCEYYNKIGLMNALLTYMYADRFNQYSVEASSAITSGFGSYTNLTPSCDAFKISVVANREKEKRAMELLLNEMQRIKQDGFIQAELDRAIAKAMTRIEKSYKESESRRNGSHAEEYVRNFLEKEPVSGAELEHKFYLKNIEELDLDQLNKFAQSYLSDTNIIFDITAPQNELVVLPSKEEVIKAFDTAKQSSIGSYTEKALNEPLLKKVPKAGKIVKEERNNELGTTTWLLSNGVRVILRSKKSKKDDVQFIAFSEGGMSMIQKVEDLPNAKYANDIVSNNGLGTYNRLDINRLLAGKNVKLTSYIKNYEEGLSGFASIKDLKILFELTYLKFTAARKDEVAYANYIEKMQTSLANATADARKAFSDSVLMVLNDYSPRTVLLEPSMLQKLNQKKALKIYKQRFANPADFTFVIVGPFKADSIKPFVLTYLGGLKTSKKKEQWKANNMHHPKGKITKNFEHAMEVEKTSVKLFYWGTMPYNLTSKLQLEALAAILDIRYTASLRENEGGTYSIRVQEEVYNKPQKEASLSIVFDTNKEKSEKLINMAQAELEKIQREGVTAAELDKVKKNFLKRYDENKKTKTWIANAIKIYEQEGINLITEFEDTVNALSSEGIQETLKALMTQGNNIAFTMNAKAK